MIKKKICIVTGSRAEYGLLYWLIKEIEVDEGLELQIIVTGMHLSRAFGSTYKIIEKDFKIDKKTLIQRKKSIGERNSFDKKYLNWVPDIKTSTYDQSINW